MKRKYFCTAIIIALLLLSFTYACTKKKPVNNNPKSKCSNTFAFDFYKSLAKSEGNIVFSPYSISRAFLFSYAGANGDTKNEMAKVFHFSTDDNTLFAETNDLKDTIESQSKDSEFIHANSLWIDKEYKIKDEYKSIIKNKLFGEIQPADFKDDPAGTVTTINKWAEKNTKQKITDIISKEDVNDLTRLIICNAVYFKDKWASEFDKSKTHDDDFFTSETTAIKVPMMSQSAKYRVMTYDTFSVVELPYKNENISMIIFLPDQKDGLKDLENNLTEQMFNKCIEELLNSGQEEMMITIPRFKMNSGIDLVKSLSELGMSAAFNMDKANFSGISDKKDLYISSAIQKAFIEVNEEGTEAAVVTRHDLSAKSAPEWLFINHPFIYFIINANNNCVLFMGRVIDPLK